MSMSAAASAPWERGRPARMRRLRAEALAEHLEAPAGLWRRASLGARASRPQCGDCGLKPSLSTWKPLRGYGGERPWERGRPRPHTRNPERPWVRGRLARIRAILRIPGCAGVPARIRAILRIPGCAGVPARMCKVLPLL